MKNEFLTLYDVFFSGIKRRYPFALSEMTGLKIEILFSPSPAEIGKEAVVILERRNSFLVLEKGKEKVWIKKGRIFKFTDENGREEIINGNDIMIHPIRKTSRLFKRFWKKKGKGWKSTYSLRRRERE